MWGVVVVVEAVVVVVGRGSYTRRFRPSGSIIPVLMVGGVGGVRGSQGWHAGREVGSSG